MHAVISLQVQDSSFVLVKPHQVSPCPILQSIQVPLSGSTTFYVSHSSQLRVISKLSEGRLYPIIQVADKDVEQQWTQRCGTPLVNRSPIRLCTTDHNLLSSVNQLVATVVCSAVWKSIQDRLYTCHLACMLLFFHGTNMYWLSYRRVLLITSL